MKYDDSIVSATFLEMLFMVLKFNEFKLIWSFVLLVSLVSFSHDENSRQESVNNANPFDSK